MTCEDMKIRKLTWVVNSHDLMIFGWQSSCHHALILCCIGMAMAGRPHNIMFNWKKKKKIDDFAKSYLWAPPIGFGYFSQFNSVVSGPIDSIDEALVTCALNTIHSRPHPSRKRPRRAHVFVHCKDCLHLEFAINLPCSIIFFIHYLWGRKCISTCCIF